MTTVNCGATCAAVIVNKYLQSLIGKFLDASLCDFW